MRDRERRGQIEREGDRPTDGETEEINEVNRQRERDIERKKMAMTANRHDRDGHFVNIKMCDWQLNREKEERGWAEKK